MNGGVWCRYPLLLGRLSKVTPADHEDCEAIKKAKTRVEEILEHINAVRPHSTSAECNTVRKHSLLASEHHFKTLTLGKSEQGLKSMI